MSDPIYRWTNPDGQKWECAAYDHGPFCRQCVPVMDADEVETGIAENVRLGYMELVGVNEDGDPLYSLTAAGEARVKGLIDLSAPAGPSEESA